MATKDVRPVSEESVIYSEQIIKDSVWASVAVSPPSIVVSMGIEDRILSQQSFVRPKLSNVQLVTQANGMLDCCDVELFADALSRYR